MNLLPPSSFPTPPGTPRRKRWVARTLLGVFGASLSAALVGTVFLRPSFADGRLQLSPRFTLMSWLDELPAHLPWVLAFALLTALIIPLRAFQWRFTLGAAAPRFRHRYHAVAIGAFCHNAIPGKLGEFARAFLLSRGHRIPFFESLGSVLVCKLLELCALVTIVSLALLGPLGGAFSDRLGPALIAAAGIGMVLVVVALVVARNALRWGRWLERRGLLPRLRNALMHLGRGLHATRSPRQLAVALAASFGPVLASALAYGVALQGLDVKLGIFAGGIVLGAISLAQLTPGLPIGTGMYYLTSSWAARALGATPAQAAAFAALTHVATFVTQLSVGVISVAIRGVRPRELLRERAEAAAPEPIPVPVAAVEVAAVEVATAELAPGTAALRAS